MDDEELLRRTDERYASYLLVSVKFKKRAEEVLKALKLRTTEVKRELHRVVYVKLHITTPEVIPLFVRLCFHLLVALER